LGDKVALCSLSFLRDSRSAAILKQTKKIAKLIDEANHPAILGYKELLT